MHLATASHVQGTAEDLCCLGFVVEADPVANWSVCSMVKHGCSRYAYDEDLATTLESSISNKHHYTSNARLFSIELK